MVGGVAVGGLMVVFLVFSFVSLCLCGSAGFLFLFFLPQRRGGAEVGLGEGW